MTKEVITIGPEAGIRDSLMVMKQHSVRHLPVVKDGLFIGLVTLGDMKQAILASMLETFKVSDVMLKDPVSVTKDTSLEKAARIIYEENIGCLPVIENKKVIGILTVNDILKAFIDIMGVLKSGARIDVILKSVHGSFDEVVSIIEQKGGHIISVGMTINDENTVHHFRLSGAETTSIVQELISLGYRGIKVIE